MGAVLAAGEGALLSHRSAGALWGICSESGEIEVTVPRNRHPHCLIVRVHRSSSILSADQRRRDGIPVTAPIRTLVDLATCLPIGQLELERRFLHLVRRAGLPLPETGVMLNGFKVDFHWPELGLVVETDGLRYHRTPAQQARDRERDQAHTAAGLTPLRFTHAQVARDPDGVARTLIAVAERLRAA